MKTPRKSPQKFHEFGNRALTVVVLRGAMPGRGARPFKFQVGRATTPTQTRARLCVAHARARPSAPLGPTARRSAAGRRASGRGAGGLGAAVGGRPYWPTDWHTNTRRRLQEFAAHSGNVQCVAMGRRSFKVLATGGDDRKVLACVLRACVWPGCVPRAVRVRACASELALPHTSCTALRGTGWPLRQSGVR